MFKKILVCLDGSELAEEILPYAREEAFHFDSELVLFRAYIVPETSMALTGYGHVAVPPPSELVLDAKRQVKNEVMTYLESIAETLREHQLKVKCMAQHFPDAGQAIVEYATENKINLVALTTHGRSGLSRTVFGSTADHVLRETGLPILVIRSKQEE
jgi:nucleotide-binding universal stress UspA family protein